MYNDTSYKLPGPAAESTDLAPAAEPAATALAPAGDPGGSAPAESRSPREWLLLVVWRQKWLVLCTFALAILAGVVYWQLATPIYRSTARIVVQPAGPVLAGQQDGLGQANTGTNFLATQKELITSEPVLKIAAESLLTTQGREKRTFKTFERQMAQARADAPADRPETPDQARARLAAILKGIVESDLDKNSDILSINAYSPYASEAKEIADAVLNAYEAYHVTPKASDAPLRRKHLEEQLKETEDKLKIANESLLGLEAQFGPLGAKDERTNIVIKHLQGLSEAWTQARRETIEAKSAFEDAARALGITEEQLIKLNNIGSEADLALGATTADLAQQRSTMLQSESQLQFLEQRYLPNHPYVIAMKGKVAEDRRKYLGLVRRVYIAAMRKEHEFQESYNEEQKNANAVSAKAKEYADIQDEVDRLKKARDEYGHGIRLLTLSEQNGLVAITATEEPKVAATPAIPSPKRILPIAAAIGLVMGLVLACMREWIDDRFHNAGDMKSSLGIPLLAVIPQSTTKRSPSVSGQRILLDPASDAAEAYRSLRTALQFAAPDGQMRTLLVTSPAAGDGKTTLASNLAIAMAQAGKKVCLVDCDLRKPMQHEIFSAKNNTGLSMLLAGRCSLESATQRTGVTGLELLPCGPAPANPGEILNSREFGDTLEQLADKYDCVVIDAPPVEAGNDARVIAALSDATLLVLKAQTAHRRSAEKARDALLGVGARLIGMVVNDVPRRTQTAYGQLAATRRYVPGLTSQEYDILQARTK